MMMIMDMVVCVWGVDIYHAGYIMHGCFSQAMYISPVAEVELEKHALRHCKLIWGRCVIGGKMANIR